MQDKIDCPVEIRDTVMRNGVKFSVVFISHNERFFQILDDQTENNLITLNYFFDEVNLD